MLHGRVDRAGHRPDRGDGKALSTLMSSIEGDDCLQDRFLARLGRSLARQSHMLSRRSLLGIGAVLFSSSPEARARRRLEYDDDEWLFGNPPDQSQLGSSGFYDDWYIGSIPDRPFPVPVVDPRRIDPKWRPQVV